MGEQIENAAIGILALPRTILQLIGWYDPTRRRVLIRGAIGILGYAIHNGKVTIPPWFYDLVNDPGFATMVAALFIPAGEKNKAPAGDRPT